LTGIAPATAQVSVAGVVAPLGQGEAINFGPATTATLTATPGILTTSASDVCSFVSFGVVSTATSLSLGISGTTAQTRILVHASSPF
jgi:hypothetical protein